MSKKIPRNKLCVAKLCPNESADSTKKIFISVPAPAERTKRSVWLKACGRDPNEINNSHVYVCEDHFNVSINKIYPMENVITRLLFFEILDGG
jgi:hypothetical protein